MTTGFLTNCACHKVPIDECPTVLQQQRQRFYGGENGQNDTPEGDSLCGAQTGEDARNAEANTRQIGGHHYGLSEYQHWDIVAEFDLDYFQGQITKYTMRHKKKNKLEDLKKAQHFLQKYIELYEAGDLEY
jgi:hypothetical protein